MTYKFNAYELTIREHYEILTSKGRLIPNITVPLHFDSLEEAQDFYYNHAYIIIGEINSKNEVGVGIYNVHFFDNVTFTTLMFDMKL